jgi:glycosyltransferase involved in cell wall biosynthesis
MDFTVILCTYNRAANLPGCIAHLAAQEGTENLDWEVLVVDNNSTDETAEIVQRLAQDSPIRIRYAFEPAQGLSNARNCGIRESDATHLIFIDDDIHAAPRWLSAYADIFSTKDCDAAGGRILVESPKPIPAWIRPEMMGFLGQLDYGEAPLALDGRNRHPFGGNMAFHRRALALVGDFDPDLGRKGEGASPDELFKGEETEYFRQLAIRGGSIWYAPNAVVKHLILPYQLKRRFFLTIHYNQGYQSAALERPRKGRKFLGVPLFLYAQTLRALGRYVWRTLASGPNHSMRQFMTAAYFVGRIRAFMTMKTQDRGA